MVNSFIVSCTHFHSQSVRNREDGKVFMATCKGSSCLIRSDTLRGFHSPQTKPVLVGKNHALVKVYETGGDWDKTADTPRGGGEK